MVGSFNPLLILVRSDPEKMVGCIDSRWLRYRYLVSPASYGLIEGKLKYFGKQRSLKKWRVLRTAPRAYTELSIRLCSRLDFRTTNSAAEKVVSGDDLTCKIKSPHFPLSPSLPPTTPILTLTSPPFLQLQLSKQQWLVPRLVLDLYSSTPIHPLHFLPSSSSSSSSHPRRVTKTDLCLLFFPFTIPFSHPLLLFGSTFYALILIANCS